jgi:hypothetical protein
MPPPSTARLLSTLVSLAVSVPPVASDTALA